MNGAQLFSPFWRLCRSPTAFLSSSTRTFRATDCAVGPARTVGGLRGAGPHRGGLRGAGPRCKVLSSVPGFYLGFPGGSDGKESACNAGRNQGSIPASGRSPGQGNGNPLLENPRDRGAWRATVRGITESAVTE